MAAPQNQVGAERRGSPAGAPAGSLPRRAFFLSSRRLWLLSVALHERGHRRLARWVKNFNSILYHNSLPPQVKVSPDVRLGHHGFGTVLHANVEIGRDVKIFHNVTIFVRPPTGTNRVVIEDSVVIGANAVLITPRNKDLRIGEGARIGAGAVVSHDVPPRMVAISRPVELRPRASGRGPLDALEHEREDDLDDELDD